LQNVGQLTDLFATSSARKVVHQNGRVFFTRLLLKAVPVHSGATHYHVTAAPRVALERDSVAFAVRATYDREWRRWRSEISAKSFQNARHLPRIM
jgi:hypothetical protein